MQIIRQGSLNLPHPKSLKAISFAPSDRPEHGGRIASERMPKPQQL